MLLLIDIDWLPSHQKCKACFKLYLLVGRVDKPHDLVNQLVMIFKSFISEALPVLLNNFWCYFIQCWILQLAQALKLLNVSTLFTLNSIAPHFHPNEVEFNLFNLLPHSNN